MPPTESTIEAYQAAAATHEDDLKSWQQQMEALAPFVTSGKETILAQLRADAARYIRSDEQATADLVQQLTDVDLTGARGLAKLVQEATTDSVVIWGERVFIEEKNFGQINDYIKLSALEKMALRADGSLREVTDLNEESAESSIVREIWLEERTRLVRILGEVVPIDIKAITAAIAPVLEEEGVTLEKIHSSGRSEEYAIDLEPMEGLNPRQVQEKLSRIKKKLLEVAPDGCHFSYVRSLPEGETSYVTV